MYCFNPPSDFASVSEGRLIYISVYSLLSTNYTSTRIGYGIEISLVAGGQPWEHGYAERLIRTLKEEEAHPNDFDDIMKA